LFTALLRFNKGMIKMTTSKATIPKDKQVTTPAIDLLKLSREERQKLIADATALNLSERKNEIAGYADAYKKKCTDAGFTDDEIVIAVDDICPVGKPRLRLSKTVVIDDSKPKRAKKGEGKTKAPTAYTKGVTYKFPGGEWVGGTPGNRPQALLELIPKDMAYEEALKKYESLAAKK
jgi:hypothetical protein